MHPDPDGLLSKEKQGYKPVITLFLNTTLFYKQIGRTKIRPTDSFYIFTAEFYASCFVNSILSVYFVYSSKMFPSASVILLLA